MYSLQYLSEKKQVSMIRKYHNHTLQTNPRHHEEEPQNTDCHKTSGRQLKQRKMSDIKCWECFFTKMEDELDNAKRIVVLRK